MRRLLLIWCLLLAGIFCVAQSERTSAFWQSRDSNYNQNVVSGGGGYTGPADVVASPTVCWSLRACSAAVRGNAAIQACDVSGANCADVLTDATTGSLPTSITRGATNCSGGTCTVKIIYDQTGSNCSGACNLTQTTVVNQALLTHNCVNTSLWCLTFNGTSTIYILTGWTSVAQPYSHATVVDWIGSSTDPAWIFYDQALGSQVRNSIAAAQFAMFAGGGAQGFNVSLSAWHSIQVIFNGGAASSGSVTDNTFTALAGAGTNNWAGFEVGGAGSASTQINITEELFYPIAFNSTQYGAVCHNQFGYWGTSVSC